MHLKSCHFSGYGNSTSSIDRLFCVVCTRGVNCVVESHVLEDLPCCSLCGCNVDWGPSKVPLTTMVMVAAVACSNSLHQAAAAESAGHGHQKRVQGRARYLPTGVLSMCP